MQAQNFPAILIAIQIAFLGWRINREIPLGDKGERTWFPVSDYLNVVSMLSIVWFCIVRPLNGWNSHETTIRLVLSIGFTFVAMHPINLIGHYRFLSGRGRRIYTEAGRGFPYVTDHEWITLGLTTLIAIYVVFRTTGLVSS